MAPAHSIVIRIKLVQQYSSLIKAPGKCSINVSYYYYLKIYLKPHFKLHAIKNYYPIQILLYKYMNTQV